MYSLTEHTIASAATNSEVTMGGYKGEREIQRHEQDEEYETE